MEQFWETLRQIGNDFVQNTGLAIVRTIAFFVLGLVVIRIMQVIARATTLKSRKLDKSASTFIVSLITVVLYVALAVLVVSSLGFSTAGIIAAFSAVALAVALALKDSLASLANGVIIIFTKPFKKGDYICIDGLEGLVQDIRLFNTKLLTYSNEEVIVPNSEVLGNKLINYTSMPLRRVVIDFPVPYSADVEEIKKFLLKGVEAYPYAVNMPAPSVVLLDYEDSTLKLSLRAWGENEHYWDLYFDLRDMILRELRAHGIANPFPQLEVSLRERNAAPADPAAPAIQNLAGSAPARNPVTQEDAGKEV